MTPNEAVVDPDFVKALSTDIHGVYYSQVAGFTPEKITAEFRKAVNDPALMANAGFSESLLFLVRKKEVTALRDDVQALLQRELQPAVEVSAMKTLYALGSPANRTAVDERLARRIFSELRAGAGLNPYLDAAERIGGPLTLNVLKAGAGETTKRQRDAEQQTPGDHVRIAQLDRVRSSFENQAFILGRRLETTALPEPRRARELASLYLRRAGYLGNWAYKELVSSASQSDADAVRAFMRDPAPLLPPAGLSEEERARSTFDLRLRALMLLEAMHAALSPEERDLLDRHRTERPAIDWEDVLDRI